MTVLRILQGVTLGGECGGAVTYVLEHAASRARAFYASFVAATPPLGLALVSLTLVTASRLLSPQDFAAYGWRVPFLLSVKLTAIGLVFRIKPLETSLFEETKRRGDVAKIPLVEAFARHPRYMLVDIAIAAGHAVLAFTATGYIFTYLTNVTKLDPISANLAVGVAGPFQPPSTSSTPGSPTKSAEDAYT